MHTVDDFLISEAGAKRRPERRSGAPQCILFRSTPIPTAPSEALSKVAIPIALYRPQIGPPARNGRKMAEKWILAPLQKKGGKNGRKMGKLPFLTHFWANFPIFRPFFPLFPGGAKIDFSTIFFPFRAGGPIWGLYRAIGIAILEHFQTFRI